MSCSERLPNGCCKAATLDCTKCGHAEDEVEQSLFVPPAHPQRMSHQEILDRKLTGALTSVEQTWTGDAGLAQTRVNLANCKHVDKGVLKANNPSGESNQNDTGAMAIARKDCSSTEGTTINPLYEQHL